MHPLSQQPIVIIGGFLSIPSFYKNMSRTLYDLSSQPVYICDINLIDWFWAFGKYGWLRILFKLKHTVETALERSYSRRVTLIGHSSGGVIARLFLSPDDFMGHKFNGLKYVSHLISLGSPHYGIRGTAMRNYVQKTYPDGYFQPDVEYISIAGSAVDGAKTNSLISRISYYCYKYICGNGDVKGDGLVPAQSALLKGSIHIILSSASHPFLFARDWYGTSSNVYKWWNEINSCLGN
ncbi:MAG: hypothetical protein GF307_06000 [candidate division Zixibacteria bacterium]|nr:hypothetical protein [candidate division Zixibacteria bacterium]